MRLKLALTMLQLLLLSRAWRIPPSRSCLAFSRTATSKTSSVSDDSSAKGRRSLLQTLKERLSAKGAEDKSTGKGKNLDELQQRIAKVVTASESGGRSDGTSAAVLDAAPNYRPSQVEKKIVYSDGLPPDTDQAPDVSSHELRMNLGESEDLHQRNVLAVDAEQGELLALEFSKLGLIDEIARGVAAQGLSTPTPVQKAVIPRIIGGENLVMAASTGSGKTFAFVLPVIQALKSQESLGYSRQPQRPRCLILVPTRELARQVLSAIKSIAHFAKVSSAAVLGGEAYAQQKASLARMVDIVVASPGRLVQHKEKGNVFLSHVTHIIIDEVDTMLTQGFGPEIRALLRAGLNKHADPSTGINGSPAQVVMATATLTKAVKQLLNDVDGNFNIEFSDPFNRTPRKSTEGDTAVRMSIVEVDGVHRTLPHVQHLVEDTKGEDKLQVLSRVLDRFKGKKYHTLIFCNTVASCRAVEFFLSEKSVECLSYHGDLNSREREVNLEKFRNRDVQYLVCSDIAARGLDIPDVEHVIMFDFPLNPIDYIHRAGRCGRAGRKGIVTALVAKRDKVLSDAIQGAIARGLPIDNLSSSKRDYTEKGRLASVLGRQSKSKSVAKRINTVYKGKPVGRDGSRTGRRASKDDEEPLKNKGKQQSSRFQKSLPKPNQNGKSKLLSTSKRRKLT